MAWYGMNMVGIYGQHKRRLIYIQSQVMAYPKRRFPVSPCTCDFPNNIDSEANP